MWAYGTSSVRVQGATDWSSGSARRAPHQRGLLLLASHQDAARRGVDGGKPSINAPPPAPTRSKVSQREQGRSKPRSGLERAAPFPSTGRGKCVGRGGGVVRGIEGGTGRGGNAAGMAATKAPGGSARLAAGPASSRTSAPLPPQPRNDPLKVRVFERAELVSIYFTISAAC